jgi:adenylate kinase family enzyme
MTKTAYLFIGRTGSGKGTQATVLLDHLRAQGRDILHVETGALFRDYMTGDGVTAGLVREKMTQGALMPAFLAVHLWGKEFVEGIGTDTDLVLDGLGRSQDDFSLLDGALDFYGYEKRIVLYIDVSPEWSEERLSTRGRADDGAHLAEVRNTWFTDDVLPVIARIGADARYTLVKINGEQTIAEVSLAMIDALQ